VTLDDLGNSLLIIALHLEIGHLAITLGRLDPSVTQQILDRHQIRIGIEQLGSHRVALMPSSA